MNNGFLLQAIKHPKSIGAVAPSSQSLSNLMLDNAQLGTASAVVELGPGTGAFTREILKRLDNLVPYLGIERNEKFASLLAREFPDNHIALGSAEQLEVLLLEHGISNCNRIISGLPWMAFSPAQQDKLLIEIAGCLPEDGLFLTYAYWPFNLLPKGRAFHAKLHQLFASVQKTDMVMNVPPAMVYICSRPHQ